MDQITTDFQPIKRVRPEEMEPPKPLEPGTVIEDFKPHKHIPKYQIYAEKGIEKAGEFIGKGLEYLTGEPPEPYPEFEMGIPPETIEPMAPLPPEPPEREMPETLTKATGFVASVGRAAGRKLIPPALDWELDSQRELAKGLYLGGDPIPHEDLVDHFVNPAEYGLDWTPMPPEEAEQFIEDQQNLESVEQFIWLGIIVYAGVQGVRALPYVGRAVKEGFSRVLWREDLMPIVKQIQKLGISRQRMMDISRGVGAKATDEELVKYEQLGKLTERKLRKPFEWVMKRFRAEKPAEVFVRGEPPEPVGLRALPEPKPEPTVEPKPPRAEVPAVKEPPVARTMAELRAIAEKEFPKPRKVEEFPVRPPEKAPEVALGEPFEPVARVEVPTRPPAKINIIESTTYKDERKAPLLGAQDEMIVAQDRKGNDLGYLWYTKEPEGGFTVRKVETGVEGFGVARELYRDAYEKVGPYRGSTGRTEEGARFIARLKETDPEIFEERKPPSPALRKILGEEEIEEKPIVAPPIKGLRIKIAERLRKTAEGMTKQIEAKRYPAIGEQRPTARRARIAASMVREADRLEIIQSKLNALADAWEAGTVPDSLKGIKSKAAIEILNKWHEFHVVEPDHWMRSDYDRLVKLGIDNPAKFEQAKKDLATIGKELPAEPTEKQQIAEKERELIGRKIPGFFTTPKPIAERMVEMADIESGMKVLEPSAGKGNIADVIRDKTKEADLSVIEWNNTLREILELKGHKLIGDDFLKHTEKYDRIIQNPPFEKFQDIDHVRHGYDLLKPGGRLISIMSESPFFRSDKEAVEFRDWLEEVGGSSEKLPEGTFKMEATATGVAGRLVTIEKPEKPTLEPPEVEKPPLGEIKPTGPTPGARLMEAEIAARKKQWGKEGEVPPEGMKGGLFEREEPKLPFAKKVKPPEKAKTFIEWVKRTGGIWDPSLKGEMREFTKEESGVPFLVRKTGKPFDTLVTQAIEDGWLPEGATGDDLREALRTDIAMMRAKGPRAQPTWAWEKEIESIADLPDPDVVYGAVSGTSRTPELGPIPAKGILESESGIFIPPESWNEAAFKARDKTYSELKGLASKLDIEYPFREIGAPETGFNIKNYWSQRSMYEEQAIEVIKKLSKYSKADRTTLALLGERPGKFFPMSAEERTHFKEGYHIVRDYFDNAYKELEALGGLEHPFPQSLILRLQARNAELEAKIARLGPAPKPLFKGMAKTEKEKRAFEWKEELEDNRKLILKLKKGKIKFVHIPTSLWFEQIVNKDPVRGMKILRILAQKGRATPTIQDLIDTDLIKPEEIDIADIVGNYGRRLGKDIALLKIIDVAKKEGLLSSEPVEGWVELPLRKYPLLKDYKAHPVFADYLYQHLENVEKQNTVEKVMSMVKMTQFYNPFILPMYDVIQGGMLGSTTSLKVPLYIRQAARDCIKKTPEYWEGQDNGIASKPFNIPWDDYWTMVEMAKKDAPMIGRALHRFGLSRWKVWRPVYEMSWHTAWTLDRFIRQISYRYLLDKGYSAREAAQMAALYHSDYASVPARTRRLLNHIFFTPTFKITMAKLQGSMLKGLAKTLIGRATKGEKKMAEGFARTLGIILGIHALMIYLGFKTDQFGRRYYKIVEVEDPETGEIEKKELVVTYSNPANMFWKYYYRFREAMEPGADHPFVEFIKKNRWELHPIYRIAWDIANNKGEDNKPIASDFDTWHHAGIKRLAYATRKIFRVLELIEEMPTGQRGQARKELRREYGLIADQVFFRLFTFPYLRRVKGERLRWRLRHLKRRFEREFKYGDEEPTETQWRNFYKEVELLFKEIEKADQEEEPKTS